MRVCGNALARKRNNFYVNCREWRCSWGILIPQASGGPKRRPPFLGGNQRGGINMHEKLEKLNREFERLARRDFSEEEQLLNETYREITAADAVGIFTNLRFLVNQDGETLGVTFNCSNEFGQFFVDTADQYICSSDARIPLSDDVCADINSAFEELRDF